MKEYQCQKAFGAIAGQKAIPLWAETASTGPATALKGGKTEAMAEDLPGNETYREIPI